MKEIDQIVQKLINKYDDCEFGIGQEESDILKIEKKLGVILPADYRYFLHKYGYFESSGPDILGAGCEPDLDEYFSMLYFTEIDAKRGLPVDFKPRPKQSIIIGPYGGGGRYFLHCENSKEPGKVELLLDELYGKPDSQSWKSFSSFLSYYLSL